jgi:hypothetical protein
MRRGAGLEDFQDLIIRCSRKSIWFTEFRLGPRPPHKGTSGQRALRNLEPIELGLHCRWQIVLRNKLGWQRFVGMVFCPGRL